MVEEHVALREARVPIVERGAPAQQVVTEVDDRERQAACDHAAERLAVRRPGAPSAEERERGCGERDRQTGEGGDADQYADRDRVTAARRDGEGAGQKEHRGRVRRVPRAAVDARKEEGRSERREERTRERKRTRRPERAEPVIEDA